MKAYMNDVSVEDAIKAGRTETICWDCKNAMRGGCSWSDPEQLKPVDGWVATGTKDSYIVHACPKFIRESYGYGRYRTVDDYILALEIALQDRKLQLAKARRVPDLLRKKNARMKKELDAELWFAEVHMSE
jgi:hypothetical protein